MENAGMSSLRSLAAPVIEENEDLYLMASLFPEDTGLPFVVWISTKGGARHDVRVKVSQSANAVPQDMISVAVRPQIKIVGNATIKGSHWKLLQQWIELNREILIRHRDGEISSKAALAEIRPVRKLRSRK